MADVPVPGSELSNRPPVGDADRAAEIRNADRAAAIVAAAIPADVRRLLETLWSNGHSAYVVGGGPRDALLGRETRDWDLATAARPEQTMALFADAVYENAFGTVAVPGAEITTFRSDHDYADFRRPHHVEFTTSIERDLARRDFTINALAWGRDVPDLSAKTVTPGVAAAQSPADRSGPRLVDRHDGLADLGAGLIRAVGDPRKRFEEDALRILRAIRLAATLGFAIEPLTLEAIRDTAPLVAHLSGERIGAELTRILAADQPSVGLGLLFETGALAAVSPELAAQRGVAQNKIPGEDLWDHTLRTVDATARRPVLRLAALLHDIGKPATAGDGHFYRHEVVGADQAAALLDRLHASRGTSQAVVHLVRQHMFRYEPSWSDAAVRRFIGKVRPAAIEDLFALRAADNIGSGVPPDADHLPILRERVARELASGPLLDRSALAIDGDDVMTELGVRPGPEVGRILDAVFERVVDDPTLNERPRLLALVREVAADDRRSRPSGNPRQ